MLAAIDFNAEAIATYRQNFPGVYALHQDLTKYPPARMADLIVTTFVDLIVTGPPCQRFSTLRWRDGGNNGPRLIEDRRWQLYREFLRNVTFFKPAVFVVDKVLGIRSAAGGEHFRR